jgi:hypothetical protein
MIHSLAGDVTETRAQKKNIPEKAALHVVPPLGGKRARTA